MHLDSIDSVFVVEIGLGTCLRRPISFIVFGLLNMSAAYSSICQVKLSLEQAVKAHRVVRR
jgi:hypothetical protein